MSDDEEFRPGELFALHRTQQAVEGTGANEALGAAAHAFLFRHTRASVLWYYY